MFYKNESMITLNPVFFLKGNNYLLESLFFIKHHSKFKKALERMEGVIHKSDLLPMEDNIAVLGFLYIYNNKLNLHFLEGTFKEGFLLVDEIVEGIKQYRNRIDEHHIMVLYYKIASLYFGAGKSKKCIEYLEKIISNKSLHMREDLMCFSRILSLLAHYEIGLDYHLDIQLKSTYKFLIKMNDLHEVQKALIRFLRNLGDIYPQDLKKEFVKLHAKLKVFEDDPYERRAFLYLDILSWLESKIENRPVDEIVQEKFKLLKR
jgi:tetratricopeptide (TPR) repeat protein